MRSPEAMARNSVLKNRPTDSMGITIIVMYWLNSNSTPKLMACCTTSPPPNHNRHTEAMLARFMLNVSNTTS